LKDVLGIGQVRQNAPANPQYHRAMPAQQRFESAFITIAREALQENLIRDEDQDSALARAGAVDSAKQRFVQEA
jgi:hypothetical protein